MAKPFHFLGQASLVRTTGVKADNLRALLRGLRIVPGSSIFYHVYHALYRRFFTASEFMNDFARWAWVTLHEERLAEKLTAIEPMELGSIREARERMMTLMEGHLGQAEYARHVMPGLEFHFLEAQTFVFHTGLEARDLEEFARNIRNVRLDVVFHHFVDARLRLGRANNDFSNWIADEFKDDTLASEIHALSPYAHDLGRLRQDIARVVERHLQRGRA